MSKPNLSLIGFLQALGIIAYCFLITGLFQFFGKFFVAAPMGFLGSVLMLALLVFSAAVTGSIVFGYPAYLVFKKRIKEALTVFGYTLLYCLGMLIIIIVILFSMQI